MASFNDITLFFNFIENTNHPLRLSPECNNYCNIIDTFLEGHFETFNNYIIFIKNKNNYPKMDFIIVDIIEHINNNYTESNKYKIFCTLFWLYIKKFNEIEHLSDKLTNIVNN